MSKDFTNFIVEWEMNLFHDYYRSVLRNTIILKIPKKRNYTI